MYLSLNQKGQAFDVFKLLIAAVVAVVILTLLLSIIGGIGIIGQGDPGEEAQTLIKDLVSSRGKVGTSQEVTFSTNTSINVRGIAQAAGGQLEDDAVCLSAGDFFDESTMGDFEESANWDMRLGGKKVVTAIEYQGSTSKVVRLRGICDVCRDITPSYIASYFPEAVFGDFDSMVGCSAKFGGKGPATETCCIVAIVKTT